MCRTDVPSEPRAKPISPVTEPVMQTIRDPYRLIKTPVKMPANDISNSFKSFNFTKNLTVNMLLVLCFLIKKTITML